MDRRQQELFERVATLEANEKNLCEDIDVLTAAVNDLTRVLNNGKFAIKILCWLAACLVSVASLFTWKVVN
jgi:anthranilate/para-aminobenzoate synthase component I